MDGPKQKLDRILNQLLEPYPELVNTGIGILNGKHYFRITNRKLKTFTPWSRHLAQDEISLEKVRLEVERLIEEASWEINPLIPRDWLSALNQDQLIQSIRILCVGSGLKYIRVICASPDEKPLLLEVEADDFRNQFEKVTSDGFLPLGLLGWKVDGQEKKAKSLLFPWHQENILLRDFFDRLCSEVTKSSGKDKVAAV
jgi:hypothetical protein